MYNLAAKPFSSKSLNQHEFFNEGTIVIVNYMLMCLSDFNTHGGKGKTQASYWMIAVIGLNIIANISLIGYQMFKAFYLSFKRKRMLEEDKKKRTYFNKKYTVREQIII